MTRLRVLTVVDQTEQDILRRISAGEWTLTLPPFKQLSALLGVSVPTLGRAVGRLAARGVLISQGPRRSFTINPKAAMSTKDAAEGAGPIPKGRLLLILPRPLGEYYGWASALFLELSLSLTREGWHFDLGLIEPVSGRITHRSLDRLAARHAPTHVLLASTAAPYVEWARAQRSFAVAFLGGEPEVAGPIPIVGADAGVAAGHLLAKLRELGHRRVLLALGSMPPRTVDRITAASATHLGLGRGDLDREGLLCLTPPDTGGHEERRLLIRHLRESGATAVLSSGLPRYLFLLDIARELRLEVPRDLSIALLSQDAIFSSLPKVPGHVKAPPALFVREVHVWLRSRKPSTVALAHRLVRHWEPGDTMAKAPR